MATFYTKYEHTTVDSDTTRVNSAVVVLQQGFSEFAVKREVEKQRPEHKNVVILEIMER